MELIGPGRGIPIVVIRVFFFFGSVPMTRYVHLLEACTNGAPYEDPTELASPGKLPVAIRWPEKLPSMWGKSPFVPCIAVFVKLALLPYMAWFCAANAGLNCPWGPYGAG
jgi:hypothetical protein